MELKIDVHQGNIHFGKRRSADDCAIAKRLKEMGFNKVIVRNSVIRLDGFRFHTPKAVRAFINRFDLNGKRAVKPFSFRLRLKNVNWLPAGAWASVV